MNPVYASSMASALSVAPHVANQGYDGDAFVQMVQSALRGMGLESGHEGIKSLGKHGDGRLETALGQFSSPAAGAALAANEVRSL